METLFDAIHVVQYQCNLCGSGNALSVKDFHRELAFCKKCGSNARFRGIIGVLGDLLGEGPRILTEWRGDKSKRGIGMSDWPGYAKVLSKKYGYENTYYDRDPKLDIQDISLCSTEKYDFIISTDVFEHILAPVQVGFNNLFKLLKPGGALVFSAPYSRESDTVEHYPGLNEFEIINFKNSRILVNKDATGAFHVYDGLVFHGGDGATLEMRLFSETDILNCLAVAGFADIRVHDRPRYDIGYYWPDLTSHDQQQPTLHAYIISAVKPWQG